MITKLLEKLREEKSHIDFMIDYLSQNLKSDSVKSKRKSILKSIEAPVVIKRKKLHWTQKPENKARLRKMLKKAAKTRSNK